MRDKTWPRRRSVANGEGRTCGAFSMGRAIERKNEIHSGIERRRTAISQCAGLHAGRAVARAAVEAPAGPWLRARGRGRALPLAHGRARACAAGHSLAEDIGKLPFTEKSDLRTPTRWALCQPNEGRVVRLHVSSGHGKGHRRGLHKEDVDVWTS